MESAFLCVCFWVRTMIKWYSLKNRSSSFFFYNINNNFLLLADQGLLAPLALFGFYNHVLFFGFIHTLYITANLNIIQQSRYKNLLPRYEHIHWVISFKRSWKLFFQISCWEKGNEFPLSFWMLSRCMYFLDLTGVCSFLLWNATWWICSIDSFYAWAPPGPWILSRIWET